VAAVALVSPGAAAARPRPTETAATRGVLPGRSGDDAHDSRVVVVVVVLRDDGAVAAFLAAWDLRTVLKKKKLQRKEACCWFVDYYCYLGVVAAAVAHNTSWWKTSNCQQKDLRIHRLRTKSNPVAVAASLHCCDGDANGGPSFRVVAAALVAADSCYCAAAAVAVHRADTPPLLVLRILVSFHGASLRHHGEAS